MSGTPPAIPSSDAILAESYAADSAAECDALRSALNAKECELASIRTRLQHNTDALTTAVERLERTVAASIDRFTRRLDRLENSAAVSQRGYEPSAASRRKRQKYGNTNYD